jgi:hypothetical protein
MSARSTLIHLGTKAGILLGALFLVGVLLAAIPGHHEPAAEQPPAGQCSGPQSPDQPSMDPSSMPGMDMDQAKTNEAHAVHDMTSGHMDGQGAHMRMTALRQQNPLDLVRASKIVSKLRDGIEKYRDYHVALEEGYKIFLPNLPQPEYHFTSYRNGFLEAFTFDAARPTSPLYKKTATGYELVGAMYTMPKHASEQELDARVPLSLARWHLHTNLCTPAREQFHTADWTKFGLRGSIASEEACNAAGGQFRPVVFGWMVHVYPYEDSLDKAFAMHHHD